MNASALRRVGVPSALLAAATLVLALLLATPQDAGAATLYACKKKDGTIRIVGKKTKCKKGQKKIKWNTVGPAGKNGANGANGANGQPQRAIRFSATRPNNGTTGELFKAAGVTFSFQCSFVLVLNAGSLRADAPSGQAYGSGIFERPANIDALATDIRTDVTITSLGGGARTIAQTTTGAASERSVRMLSVWTTTVEGPSGTVWIRATMDTDSSCSIRGTAIAIPD